MPLEQQRFQLPALRLAAMMPEPSVADIVA